jgi:hypothetical protein
MRAIGPRLAQPRTGRKEHGRTEGESVHEGVHGEAGEGRPAQRLDFVDIAFPRLADVHRHVLLDDVEGEKARQDVHSRPVAHDLEGVGRHVEEGCAQQDSGGEPEHHAELCVRPRAEEGDRAAHEGGQEDQAGVEAELEDRGGHDRPRESGEDRLRCVIS